MVDRLSSIQEVYNKWERKGPHTPNISSTSADHRNGLAQGKQEWVNKFGDVRPPQFQRFRNRSRLPPVQVDPSSTLGDFKQHPTIPPESSRFFRPFMGRCCSCLPKSREMFYDSETTAAMGMRSVLNVPTNSRKHSILIRAFSHIVFTARQRVDFTYPDVTRNVLTSQRIFTAIQLTLRKELQDRALTLPHKSIIKYMKNCRKKAQKILHKMQAVMRLSLIRFTGWFLLKALGLLLTSIQVHNGQLHMLQKAAEVARPVIYIPLHRSHMDYVLMTFILWHYGLRAPYVAAGDNLNILLFGPLLRSLGGFFIRRRLDRRDGEKDLLYRAILQQYVEELLRADQAIEFFIEGGRTRSGKALSPKAGLLSIVVEALNSGTIRDAYIVPVSISYEKILDGTFNREQLGLPKVKESFWRTVKGLWRVFTSTYGSVRVDFGQPFSLKEYVNNVSPLLTGNRPQQGVRGKTDVDSKSVRLPPLRPCLSLTFTAAEGSDEDYAHDDNEVRGQDGNNDRLLITRQMSSSPPTPACVPSPVQYSTCGDALSRISSATSMTSIYGIDERDDQKALVGMLAKHVIYNCVSASAIMSTNLLAFVFINVYRKGARLDDLISCFDEMRDEVAASGRDVGFRGHSADIIMHALSLVGSTIIHITDPAGNLVTRAITGMGMLKDALLVPILTLPSVFEWTYYSNPVISVFDKDSAVACAVWAAAAADEFSIARSDLAEDEQSFVVTADSVIEKALLLCKLLQYEFFFAPPCTNLEAELRETFEGFVTKEILQHSSSDPTAGLYSTQERQWASRFCESVAWDDDDEAGDGHHDGPSAGGRDINSGAAYYVNMTRKDCLKKLELYRKMLVPYVEAYWFIICGLMQQLTDNAVIPEEKFIRDMQHTLIDRVEKGLTEYPETASHDILTNVMRMLFKINVTDSYTALDVKMISLHNEGHSEERLLEIIDLLQSCRT